MKKDKLYIQFIPVLFTIKDYKRFTLFFIFNFSKSKSSYQDKKFHFYNSKSSKTTYEIIKTFN